MKWILIIFLILLGVVLIIGGLGYLQLKSQTPPSVEDAPFAVQTYSQDDMKVPSRVYYPLDVKIINGHPIIKEYWSFDGSRYRKYNEEKELPENSKVIRRKE